MCFDVFQHDVSLLCEAKGVIHHTSCSRTSQQNDVAKRKHRHLLDVIRTLMIQMKIPQQLWADAILTACHLINRMPSSVHGYIPHCFLFLQKSLFSLPLKVFGCVCFVQDTCPNLDTLSSVYLLYVCWLFSHSKRLSLL